VKIWYYIRNVRNPLIGSAAVYLAANALNAVVPFVLLPLLTRKLQPEDYGRVGIFSLVLQIMSALVGLSVHGLIAVKFFSVTTRRLRLLVTGGLLLSLCCLVVVLGLVWIADGSAEKVTGLPSWWLALSVLAAAFQTATNVRLAIWQCADKPLAYGAIQLFQGVTSTVLSVMFVVAVGLTWRGRALGMVIAVVATGAISFWSLRRDRFLEWRKDFRATFAEIAAFGMPAIPYALGGMLIAGMDRLVVANTIGFEQSGIYIVAYQVGQGLSLIHDAGNRVFAPWLMQRLVEPSRELQEKVVTGTYLACIIIMLVGVLYGGLIPLVLNVLVGKSFVVPRQVTMLMALAFSFGGCYLLVANYLFYLRKTHVLALITVSVGVTNLPMMWLFVVKWGIVGGAATLLISNALLFVATWWFANKFYPMPWWTAWSRYFAKTVR
jgi:O-antigen/teichoic acid export membrane protein